MWDEKDLRVIPINLINNLMHTNNIKGFCRVNSEGMEYVQGFLLRGDARDFNHIFIEGFSREVVICPGETGTEKFGFPHGTRGIPTVLTTAHYNFANDYSETNWYVYMIDATNKLGVPLKSADSRNYLPFCHIYFIDAFAGTDVIGFIRRQGSNDNYDLVCNPDYSGDLNYVNHVINTPHAKSPELLQAPMYSKDFINNRDEDKGGCIIL
ncbi:hypothetical protein [Candidatus Sororendozoicomonas aggregata]|uniref:hypothetical protein n=1 Tax=Candidatus Sororendozoicomonas aggregata TaxID=3073239 RepID=UPI002ED03D2D